MSARRYGEWVPCYASLFEGDKRNLARATRLIYLELSLRARRFDGALPLPRGFKTDTDSVHDVIGGDKKEIKIALAELTFDDGTGPMLTVSGPPERRMLTVLAHSDAVKQDKSADRMRKLRDKRKQSSPTDSDNCDASHSVTDAVTSDVTDQRHVTLQRREEKRTEEKSIAPRVTRSAVTGSEFVSSDHQRVMACYAEEFTRARGVKPAITARAGKAAKDMVTQFGGDETCQMIRNAFADAWFAKTKCELWDIAKEPNKYRGRVPQLPTRGPPVQQSFDPNAPWLKAAREA